MGCVTCFGRSFASVTRAMAGSPHPLWPARALVCQTCHLLVTRNGTQYCGRPFLHLPVRDQTIEGCGCPILEKAKSREEHCPLTARSQPAATTSAGCDCKWCRRYGSLCEPCS